MTTSMMVPMEGGKVRLHATTAATCGWNVQGNASWVTMELFGQTSGSSNLELTIPANPGNTRTTNFVLGGRTLTVQQFGATGRAADAGGTMVLVSPSVPVSASEKRLYLP